MYYPFFYKIIKANILLKFFILLSVLALVINLSYGIANALSSDQLNVFSEGINYFDTTTCNTGTNNTTSTPPPSSVSITISGPFKPKAYPSDNINPGDSYQGTASTYGNDPFTGYVDPGDVDSNGNPLLPALQGATNAQPAIAVYNSGSLGGWWAVIAPNGTSAILQQTDVGPSTTRIVDINSVAARTVFNYQEGSGFPTDQGSWKIKYLGKTQPAGATTKAPGAGSSSPSTQATPIQSCCSTNGAVNLVGNTPEEQTWNYFIGQGLNNVQVAGIMGNLKIESGFNPTIVYGGGSSSDPSNLSVPWGLVQWNPGSKVVSIQQQAGVSGNIADLPTQLAIIWWEMSTNHSPSSGWDFSQYKSSSNASQAAEYFEAYFEGAGGEGLQARENAANMFFSTASGGTGTQQASSNNSQGSSDCVNSTNNSTGYETPFRTETNLVSSRVDEGVDYSTNSGTQVPVYAIGNGTVTQVAKGNSSFYPPLPNWVTYKLNDGPAAGKYIYVAEDCPPLVNVGDSVNTGTILCYAGDNSIETGWALDSTSQAAAAYGSYVESNATAYGQNFAELMDSLGVKTKPCYDHPGETLEGSLPSGWPQWVSSPATRAGPNSC